MTHTKEHAIRTIVMSVERSTGKVKNSFISKSSNEIKAINWRNRLRKDVLSEGWTRWHSPRKALVAEAKQKDYGIVVANYVPTDEWMI